MTDDVYRRLAETLDAIPNGFPSTESGCLLYTSDAADDN